MLHELRLLGSDTNPIMTDNEDSVAISSSGVIVQERTQPERRIDPTKAFSSLRHRNYHLFFTGQLISLIGTWMQNVAQSWLVYQLTGSPFYLGLVSFASAVPVLVLSLWAGVIIRIA